MINKKLIYKILGSLLFLESTMVLLCLIIAIYYREDDTFAFAFSAVITFLGGIVMRQLGVGADNSLSRCLSWSVAISIILPTLFLK